MVDWVDLVKTREGYEKLLDNVMGKLPQTLGKIGDRVLVVNPIIYHEAHRTIITNFTQIAETINREASHLARFILKESGKAGIVEGERLIIQGKEFVKCPVCGGLDTKIVAEKRFRFLLCEVCGAKSSIRKI
ncbi:MAG: hypothetical protein QW095_01640 [Nitrososphaerota archaeon]